jgi:type VI secretion system protein ImpF
MEVAASVPLFERLIDDNPEESFEKHSKRFLTFLELQESVLRDLSYLLNTRVSPFWKNYADNTATPYSYGVNVTAPTSAENVFEIQALESRVDEVVRLFEPRLVNAKSSVVGPGSDPSNVFVNVEATMDMEHRKMPLSFPVVIDT